MCPCILRAARRPRPRTACGRQGGARRCGRARPVRCSARSARVCRCTCSRSAGPASWCAARCRARSRSRMGARAPVCMPGLGWRARMVLQAFVGWPYGAAQPHWGAHAGGRGRRGGTGVEAAVVHCNELRYSEGGISTGDLARRGQAAVSCLHQLLRTARGGANRGAGGTQGDGSRPEATAGQHCVETGVLLCVSLQTSELGRQEDQIYALV